MATELMVCHGGGRNVYAVFRIAANRRDAVSSGNIGKWWNATTGAVETFDGV